MRQKEVQIKLDALTLPLLHHDPKGVGHHSLVQKSTSSTLGFFLKRGLDIGLTLGLLIVLSPLLLLIALAIKLDSKGPVLFVQERVGSKRTSKPGKIGWKVRRFPIYKFRTMTHQADQTAHQAFIQAFVVASKGTQEIGESDDAPYKLTNDPRVTRVGKVLRTTSLDELPQLINVLKGEMSLVGPRPVPVYEVEEYEAWHYERLHALPGITGLWQVKGRGRATFDELIRMDIAYVRNQSLWLDLWLLLLTVPAVLSRRGAK